MLKVQKCLLLIILTAFPVEFIYAENNYKQNDSNLVIKDVDKETISINGRLTVNLAKLRAMGITDKINPKELTRLIKQLRLISAAQSGLMIGGAPEYTCDSSTNKCTCDNQTPLDCLDILDECSGDLIDPTLPTPGKICGISPKTCECRWH